MAITLNWGTGGNSGNTTATSISVSLGNGTNGAGAFAAGDIIVIGVVGDGASSATISLTGFTLIPAASAQNRFYFYRVCTGTASDPQTSSISITWAGTACYLAAVAFTVLGADLGFDPSATAWSSGTTAAAISPAGSADLLVVLCTAFKSSNGPQGTITLPSGFTDSGNNQLSDKISGTGASRRGAAISAGYQTLSASGSTGTQTFTDSSGTDTNSTVLLAFRATAHTTVNAGVATAAGVASAAGPLPPVTYRASSGAYSTSAGTAVTSQSLTIPSAVQQGDLVLVAVAVGTSAAAASTVSLSGGGVTWTLLGSIPLGGSSVFGTGINLAVFAAIAGASTPGASVTETNGTSGQVQMGCVAYVGAVWAALYATQATTVDAGAAVMPEPSGYVGGAHQMFVEILALWLSGATSVTPSDPADASNRRVTSTTGNSEYLGISDSGLTNNIIGNAGGNQWSWSGVSADGAAALIALTADPVYQVYQGVDPTGGLGVSSITVPLSTLPGDAIVVTANVGTAVSAVTDSQNNTYVQISQDTGTDTSLWVATYNGSAGTPTAGLAGGTDTITMHGPGSGGLIVAGVRGVDSVAADAAPAFASGTSASPSGPATGPLTQSGDILLYALMGTWGTTAGITSYSGSLSAVSAYAAASPANGTGLAWQTISGTTSVTPGGTLSASQAWDGFTVALSPPASGTRVNAGIAAAAAVASAPSTAVKPSSAICAGAAQATAASASIKVNAGVAAAGGIANAATVSTVPATSVNAGVATASALASPPASALTSNASVAQASAVVPPAAPSVAAKPVSAASSGQSASVIAAMAGKAAAAAATGISSPAGAAGGARSAVAGASGAATAASAAVVVNAAVAAASGVANPATASTVGNTQAFPPAAASSALASPAAPAITAPAASAASAGAAVAPAASVAARAGVAAAAGSVAGATVSTVPNAQVFPVAAAASGATPQPGVSVSASPGVPAAAAVAPGVSDAVSSSAEPASGNAVANPATISSVPSVTVTAGVAAAAGAATATAIEGWASASVAAASAVAPNGSVPQPEPAPAIAGALAPAALAGIAARAGVASASASATAVTGGRGTSVASGAAGAVPPQLIEISVIAQVAGAQAVAVQPAQVKGDVPNTPAISVPQVSHLGTGLALVGAMSGSAGGASNASSGTVTVTDPRQGVASVTDANG